MTIERAATFNITILNPALTWFHANSPSIPVTRSAHVLMLAIAGQESDWTARIQGGNGPAHGFWQFERMGGVNGVLTHPASKDTAAHLCSLVSVPVDPVHVWRLFATQEGDNLAAAFARLLLWTDPHSLPSCDDEDATWLYYQGLWRPGDPPQADWAANLRTASMAFGQEPA